MGQRRLTAVPREWNGYWRGQARPVNAGRHRSRLPGLLFYPLIGYRSLRESIQGSGELFHWWEHGTILAGDWS